MTRRAGPSRGFFVSLPLVFTVAGVSHVSRRPAADAETASVLEARARVPEQAAAPARPKFTCNQVTAMTLTREWFQAGFEQNPGMINDR